MNDRGCDLGTPVVAGLASTFNCYFRGKSEHLLQFHVRDKLDEQVTFVNDRNEIQSVILVTTICLFGSRRFKIPFGQGDQNYGMFDGEPHPLAF